MEFVYNPHKLQVLIRNRTRLAIHAAATNSKQLTLPLQRQAMFAA